MAGWGYDVVGALDATPGTEELRAVAARVEQVDAGALADLGRRYASLADDMDTSLRAVADRGDGVGRAWQGPGADAFARYAADFARAGSNTGDAARRIQGELAGLGRTLAALREEVAGHVSDALDLARARPDQVRAAVATPTARAQAALDRAEEEVADCARRLRAIADGFTGFSRLRSPDAGVMSASSGANSRWTDRQGAVIGADEPAQAARILDGGSDGSGSDGADSGRSADGSGSDDGGSSGSDDGGSGSGSGDGGSGGSVADDDDGSSSGSSSGDGGSSGTAVGDDGASGSSTSSGADGDRSADAADGAGQGSRADAADPGNAERYDTGSDDAGTGSGADTTGSGDDEVGSGDGEVGGAEGDSDTGDDEPGEANSDGDRSGDEGPRDEAADGEGADGNAEGETDDKVGGGDARGEKSNADDEAGDDKSDADDERGDQVDQGGDEQGDAQADGGAGTAPSSGRGGVQDWIRQATAILAENGVDPEKMKAADIATIIEHESGGDPDAVNDWDSNADKGTPSKGLMQTIGPTFEANKLPGHDSITDPVDNIIAAVRYAIRRYGSVSEVPGVEAVARGDSYVGY